MTASRLPTYYLSHGGGPWPYMKRELGGRYDQLEASLTAIRSEVGEAPRAVLMVSAHWEAPDFTVSSGAWPGMIYDYYGFPEHTYRVVYAAPGSPELAARVRGLLQAGGLACREDADRGYDHGTFSMMQPLYPQADMPLVQISLRADYDAQAHLQAGRLLAPLREQGVLILGSGSSYHNLRHRGPEAVEPSRRFDGWLQDTLTRAPPRERWARLADWEQAPAARAAHPSEDHLLPLMVAAGAAEQEAGAVVYHQGDFGGVWTVSSFRFGEAAQR
jgi:aromatic ring-opening dioxygenase catalytic subunit (LigB family)